MDFKIEAWPGIPEDTMVLMPESFAAKWKTLLHAIDLGLVSMNQAISFFDGLLQKHQREIAIVTGIGRPKTKEGA
jgi:hypothetical protein